MFNVFSYIERIDGAGPVFITTSFIICLKTDLYTWAPLLISA